MENNQSRENNAKKLSRRKLISSLGVASAAVVAGGLFGGKTYGAVVDSVTGSAAESTSAAKFTGILDGTGKILFAHGLGASLPANVLIVNAFIKLPDGKARKVDVDYINETHISVACGVPNTPVRVGLIYSNSNAAW